MHTSIAPDRPHRSVAAHVRCALGLAVALTCAAAPTDAGGQVVVDPARSLLVTDRALLDSPPGDLFALRRVLTQLASQSRVDSLTALDLWRQWWDTLDRDPGVTSGPHCDRHRTAVGRAGINGFPISCPREEGREARENPFDPSGAAFYATTALVNRFDLAPPDGSDCGEYRMVFARRPSDSGGRNLLIFEAILPNPTPERGIEGCRAVATFWANLGSIDAPDARARALADFYFDGLPGFSPVITIGAFVSGQIRTNMFLEPLWQLREFKLQHRCGASGKPCRFLRFRPVTVKGNPFGALFDDSSPEAKGPGFRRALVKRLPRLLPDDLMEMSFPNPGQFNAGQSTAQRDENNYVAHFQRGRNRLSRALQNRLTASGSDLTPEQIVKRAMTQSCAGCHELSSNRGPNDLGHGLTWPRSLGFVHIDEDGNLSEALDKVFLPHRQGVLEDFLNGRALRAPAPGDTENSTVGGPRRTH